MDPNAVPGRKSATYEPRADAVARQIREAILAGRYAPGSPLRQEPLAQELGVSRIPVREALRRLEAEGLVVSRPHSGARVAILDFAECVEIYKIRERLEPLAFSESVGRLTREQLDQVVELAASLESLTGDQGAWLDRDRRLHLAMYAGIETPRLLRMIVGFWDTTHPYRRLLVSTFGPSDFALAHAEHELIVDALLTGNARAGEGLLRVAMERSRRRLEANEQLFDR